MPFRVSPLAVLLCLAVSALAADERGRPFVDPALSRVVAAGEAGALLDPASASVWRGWAQGKGDFAVAAQGEGPLPAMGAGVRLWRRAGAFAQFDTPLVPPGQLDWVKKGGLFATRSDGFTPGMASWPVPELPNAALYGTRVADTTREEVFRSVRDRMDAAFDAGFDGFRLDGYAWPSAGGRWGTGASALAQWKACLKGHGPRIDLSGPDETWDFPAYWQRFSSLPLDPAAFGWDTWDDFRYGGGFGTFAARRLLLFDALWHFHHLAFADRLGREAEARGRELAVALPPEERANGADDVLFARLRHLGAVGIDVAGGPGILPALHHALDPLRWRDGKAPRIDVTGNADGMDRGAAAVFFYQAAAACLPRMYRAGSAGAVGPDRQSPAWSAGAAAFLLRHAEEAQSPAVRPEVTVVASRSVLDDVAGSSHSLAQEGSLAPYLDALHVDFDLAGRDAWDGAADRHSRVVVLGSARATPEQLKGARAWLDAGHGKVLIAVGGAPWRSDQEVETSLALFPLAGQREAGLSFADAMLRTAWWDAAVPSRKVVAADDAGVPLLTTWRAGDNRVVHINADLPVSSPLSPLGLALVRVALAQAKVVPFAPPQADWTLERYSVPGGAVVAAWNRPLLARQEEKDAVARQPLASPGEVVLTAPPGAPLRLYSALDDKVWLQAADADGKLRVEAPSSPLLLYYGPDAPAMRETIARARAAFHPAD